MAVAVSFRQTTLRCHGYFGAVSRCSSLRWIPAIISLANQLVKRFPSAKWSLLVEASPSVRYFFWEGCSFVVGYGPVFSGFLGIARNCPLSWTLEFCFWSDSGYLHASTVSIEWFSSQSNHVTANPTLTVALLWFLIYMEASEGVVTMWHLPFRSFRREVLQDQHHPPHVFTLFKNLDVFSELLAHDRSKLAEAKLSLAN